MFYINDVRNRKSVKNRPVERTCYLYLFIYLFYIEEKSKQKGKEGDGNLFNTSVYVEFRGLDCFELVNPVWFSEFAVCVIYINSNTFWFRFASTLWKTIDLNHQISRLVHYNWSFKMSSSRTFHGNCNASNSSPLTCSGCDRVIGTPTSPTRNGFF